jgi:hypothetical protein
MDTQVGESPLRSIMNRFNENSENESMSTTTHPETQLDFGIVASTATVSTYH